jgi:hypothetical protein
LARRSSESPPPLPHDTVDGTSITPSRAKATCSSAFVTACERGGSAWRVSDAAREAGKSACARVQLTLVMGPMVTVTILPLGAFTWMR